MPAGSFPTTPLDSSSAPLGTRRSRTGSGIPPAAGAAASPHPCCSRTAFHPRGRTGTSGNWRTRLLPATATALGDTRTQRDSIRRQPPVHRFRSRSPASPVPGTLCRPCPLRHSPTAPPRSAVRQSDAPTSPPAVPVVRPVRVPAPVSQIGSADGTRTSLRCSALQSGCSRRSCRRILSHSGDSGRTAPHGLPVLVAPDLALLARHARRSSVMPHRLRNVPNVALRVEGPP